MLNTECGTVTLIREKKLKLLDSDSVWFLSSLRVLKYLQNSWFQLFINAITQLLVIKIQLLGIIVPTTD